MHVLRADFDVLRFAERFVHFRDRGERRQDHDFHLGQIADLKKQRPDERGGLGLRHVHFPIRGYDFFRIEVIGRIRVKIGNK